MLIALNPIFMLIALAIIPFDLLKKLLQATELFYRISKSH